MFGLEHGKCAGGIRYQFARRSYSTFPDQPSHAGSVRGGSGQAIDVRHCGYLFLLTRGEDVKTFQGSVACAQTGGDDRVADRRGGSAPSPLMRAEDVLARLASQRRIGGPQWRCKVTSPRRGDWE